jgi:hypothetical protein
MKNRPVDAGKKNLRELPVFQEEHFEKFIEN